MSKTSKFALTTIWILFSRSYDAYCTNLLTPDLSKESNPLVSVFGLGWTPLLLILSLLLVYIIYAYYISLFKPINQLPQEKNYTFSNMVAYTYLGYKSDWFTALFKLPKSFHWFTHYMGHVFTRCLVFAGIVSTIMWLLINHTNYYQTLHSPELIYSILLIGCVGIIYDWNRKKYQEYLRLVEGL